jgi:hypothetical protein
MGVGAGDAELCAEQVGDGLGIGLARHEVGADAAIRFLVEATPA